MPDPKEIAELFRAVLGHAPAHLAADLASLWAATAVALVPGTAVGTDIGVVLNSPDPRFPDEPFVREGDETRWSLRALGDVYLLDAELVAGVHPR